MYGHTHVFIGFIHRVSRWGSFKGGHLNISIYRLFPPPWIIKKDCISGCQCCSSVPNTRKENWDFLVVHCIDLCLIPAPLFFFWCSTLTISCLRFQSLFGSPLQKGKELPTKCFIFIPTLITSDFQSLRLYQLSRLGYLWLYRYWLILPVPEHTAQISLFFIGFLPTSYYFSLFCFTNFVTSHWTIFHILKY